MKINNLLKLIVFVMISFIFFNFNLKAESNKTKFIKGEYFILRIKQLAGDDTEVEGDFTGPFTEDYNIKHIKRSYILDITPTEDNIVSIEDSFKPIYAWFDAESETIFYYSEAETLYLNEEPLCMFAILYEVIDIDLETIDTSDVTDMYGMFAYDYKLSDIDVSHFNLSNVTSLSHLFYACESLTSLDISDWDVSNVTDMVSLFYGCTSLEVLDIKDWDVSKVETFRCMFCGNSHVGDMKIKTIDIAGWDTSSAVDMTCMFYGMGAIEHLDVSDWNVSNVTSFNHMFCDNNKLKELDLSKWDVSSVKTMNNMFDDAYELETIGDVSHWNTSSLIDVDGMFNNCTKFKENGTIDLSGWNTSNLKVSGEMFRAVPAKIIDLSNWDLSSMTNEMWEGAGSGIYYSSGNQYSYPGMKGMFLNMPNLEKVYVGTSWVIPEGVNTDKMFQDSPIDSVTLRYKLTYYDNVYSYFEPGESIAFNSDIQKAGYSLIGYNYNNVDYELTDTFEMPEENIALTPLWEIVIPQISQDSGFTVSDNYLKKMPLSIEVSEVDLKIDSVYETKVVNKDDQEKTEGLLATGDKIQIYLDGVKISEYKVVIMGDANGNGEITYADVVQVFNHKRKSGHPELTTVNLLEGEYFIAGDMNENGEITYADVVQVFNKVRELKTHTN